MPTRTTNCITVCPFYISNGGDKKPEPFMVLKQEFKEEPKHPFRITLQEGQSPEAAIPRLMNKYGATECVIHETSHPTVFVVQILSGEMQNEAKQFHHVNFFAATTAMNRNGVVHEGLQGVSALAEFIRHFMQEHQPTKPVNA